MNATASLWSSMCLFGLLLVGGGAATGPSYEDIIADADPIAGDAVRIFFLRPRDSDDGSNGDAASIEVNQVSVGALHYGGFFYVDVEPGSTTLASAVEGKGKRCRGPLKLKLLAEEDALLRLTDLTWSGD